MKLLWVATKPPFPPRDGGRLALGLTLEALRAAGHEVTLIAPEHPHTWIASLAVALRSGLPLAIARHALPPLRQSVARALQAERFDVVVAEQLHALPQCEPAIERGLPVVLRAQNVESDLWLRQAHGAATPLMRWEARRLARYEAAALRRVTLTLALTRDDAARLHTLAKDARIETVAVPFPQELLAGADPLPGSPALVILAGAGWRPNVDGARWFVDSIWPRVQHEHPQARLHVFGSLPQAAGVQVHPAPSDSAAAFPRGSIHVVPLQVASGVRMKVLEAWARGVPVIATTAAAAGLESRDGEALLLADDATAFAAALARFETRRGLADELVAGGRAALATRHDPALIAARWTALLGELVS